MSNDDKRTLTKNWISIMLFTGPKDSDELIRNGCKIMVFGWGYEDFINIIAEMESEKFIDRSTTGSYHLAQKGLYDVKRNSIIPLLNLCENSEYVSAFIEKNKENCDYQFIEMLHNQNSEEIRETSITNYAVRNYDKLAILITLIKEFLTNPPSV